MAKKRMKHAAIIALFIGTICVVLALFLISYHPLPRQEPKNVDPKALIGFWRSVDFDGLCARDFALETFTFRADGTFEETTRFKRGVEAELNGTYVIEGDTIKLDDGKGYTPSLPFYINKDILMISRRANIGRVRVTFKRTEK